MQTKHNLNFYEKVIKKNLVLLLILLVVLFHSSHHFVCDYDLPKHIGQKEHALSILKYQIAVPSSLNSEDPFNRNFIENSTAKSLKSTALPLFSFAEIKTIFIESPLIYLTRILYHIKDPKIAILSSRAHPPTSIYSYLQ